VAYEYARDLALAAKKMLRGVEFSVVQDGTEKPSWAPQYSEPGVAVVIKWKTTCGLAKGSAHVLENCALVLPTSESGPEDPDHITKLVASVRSGRRRARKRRDDQYSQLEKIHE
jgi:hypothetical protein